VDNVIIVSIDGIEVKGQIGETVLTLANRAGVEIPNLCHSDELKVYASCGICAVEVAGRPRLARACSTLAVSGMEVVTTSARVQDNRKATLDLLLSEHKGDCVAPCKLACPAASDCQSYVSMIAEGNAQAAMDAIMDKIPLPASIGRVCPRPCEAQCRRGLVDEPVAIGSIKEFVADSAENFKPMVASPSGRRVAIIGGGPGGLSAAYFLRQAGHEVTIYDGMPKMGGMLRYGIPEYRLPKAVLDKEIQVIANMGVRMENNVKIGKDMSFEEIKLGADALVVAVGAWKAAGLNCAGESLDGVIDGIRFLRDVALENAPDFCGKKIAVVGGGNTAMDACRTALRLGAKAVYNIYRRTRDEMPAEDIEVSEADEEGVIFKFLVNPLEIKGENGKVIGMDLQIMELGEPDEQGRRTPKPVSGDAEFLSVDYVIVAIGQWADLTGIESLCPNRRGNVSVKEDFSTNIPGVFAIGDAVDKGAGIAIEAIAAAKTAFGAVHAYLEGNPAPQPRSFVIEDKTINAETFAEVEKAERLKIPHRAGSERKNDFAPVNLPLTLEAVKAEAARCLKCGCHAYNDCKLIKYSNDCEVNPKKYTADHGTREVTNPQKRIIHDPNKCILCGLCVRTCEEIVGATALGLVGRGFATTMSLAALPLPEDLDCESCKKCVKSCPTGALQ